MSYNWTTDYLNLSTMLRRGQDPRDKEPPMIDHSQDLLDIMPMDYIETQSTASSMSVESATPTSDRSQDTLMANIDALSSLQAVTSLLQRVNVADSKYPPPSQFNTPVQNTTHYQQPTSFCPMPAQPVCRESYSSVVQRPNPRDLWRSTLTQPAPDFSVFDPCSKLPEVHTHYQHTVFDPDNAEIDDSYCVLCKKNGEQRDFYVSHVLKDSRGKVVCPILRKYVCPTCGATGDNAHTIRHCPKSTK